jgi:hypothetical protein
VEGDYVYIACSLWGIKIVNVSNPANPYEVGKYVTRGQGAQGIDAIGEYAFLPDDEFFHIFNCSAAIGNVDPLELSIEPYNPPVIIPPGGGEFQFGVAVENPNTVSLGFDLWGQIDLPVGGSIETFFVEEFQLGSGNSNTWHYEQSIPFNAPPGIYTYYAYIGEYPWDVAVLDSFMFEKEGAEGVDYIVNPGGWPCREIFDVVMFETVSAPIMANKSIRSHPNPFNAATVISFALPEAARVILTVYDVSGRLVNELVNGMRPAGTHEVAFDGTDLASGIYIYRLEAGDYRAIKKVVLVK